MANKIKSSLIKNTSFVTFSQVASVATAVVVSILVARYLGPEGKGQLALALGMGVMLGQILCFGFDMATPYFLASGKLEPGKALGAWIVTFVIGTVLAYGVVYPLFIYYLSDDVFSGVTKVLLLIGGLGCPLYMLRLLINSIMTGYEEFTKQIRHNILIYLTNIGVVFLCLLVLHTGAVAYAQIQMGVGFCTLIYGAILLGRVTRLNPEFSLSAWLKMFNYGIKAALSQVFRLVDLRFDIFVVNYFTETSLVGVYTVAGGLARMFGILPSSIGVVLLPRTAGSDRQEANKRTAILCRNALWLTVISGVFFLAISKQLIVFVYTERFADAALALTILMPGVVGQAVSQICFADCSARGFPEKATYSTAVTAFLTIMLDIYLIPRHGIYGAAVASSIAYCTGGIFSIYWHLKVSGNNLAALIIPRKADLRYYSAVFCKLKSRITN